MIEKIKNTTIKQQPFFLRGDRLYISTKFAKEITPFNNKQNNKTEWRDFVYKKNVEFFKDTKEEWVSSTGGVYNSYVANQANTNITVRYKGSYGMNLYIKRGNEKNNEFGKFKYYIGGYSGDFEMHGKNMIRNTRECNLNLIIKYYPIVSHIKDFYKKLKNKPFFDIIKEEILNNTQLADYTPDELSDDQDVGHLKMTNNYNI